MHTFTMSEFSTRGKAYIIATEYKPHGRVEIVDNIDDAALFVFWKFAHHSEIENDKIQVTYSIFHSQTVFPHSNMLKTLKYNAILGLRRQRGCKQNGPVDYSDDKKPSIPNRQEKLPVSSQKKKGSKKNGPKKNGWNSGGQKKDPCPKHAGRLRSDVSNTADEEARGPNDFQGKMFLNLINQSIFPQKNDDGN